MTRFGWLSWMLTATLVGAGAGLITAARTPHRYRSEASIRVVAHRLPETDVRSAATTRLSDRVQSSFERILSRTTLERMIREFNMYPEERRHAPMDDVVENVREHIDIQPQGGDSFRVAFVGTEPGTVMMVAERLAAMFLQDSLRRRELLAESTHKVLQSQLEDLRTRLIRKKQQLNAARQAENPEAETMTIESEVLEATFTDLLTRVEDSQLASNLERRQTGEQFELIEPARVPESPFSPDRRIYASIGAAAGLAAGLLLWLVIRWSRLRGMQQRAVPVEA